MAPCASRGRMDADGGPEAFRVAQGLSNRLGLRLAFVHAAGQHSAPSSGATLGAVPGWGQERAAAVLLAERLLDEYDVAAHAEPHAQVGDPVDRLAAAAGARLAAAVVARTQGRGVLESLLLESTSTGLPARAPRTLVLAPRRE